MIETRRLKNVIFYPNNFKFCAVKKSYKYFIILFIFVRKKVGNNLIKLV